MSLPARVRIYEVGPRDGLQNETKPLATETKRRYVELLVAAGQREIEATSFVSPKAIPQLADIIPGMKHHHEKWEGGGYPDGIKGEQIPMQARIVTVADTFDAMTTTRPYQKAMEIGYVVERIKSFSGVRYDPVVVAAFLRACARGKFVPPPREPIVETADEVAAPLRRAL